MVMHPRHTAWSAAAAAEAAGTYLVAVQLGLEAADLLLLLLAGCFALPPPLPALGAVHAQLQLCQLPLDLPWAAVRPRLLHTTEAVSAGMLGNLLRIGLAHVSGDDSHVLHIAAPASSRSPLGCRLAPLAAHARL